MIRGIQRNADEQHHHSQEDDAGKKVHGLQFTYLVDAALNLPMNKIMPTPNRTAPNTAINQSVGFPLAGVEISQPTSVISVTTIIPSQNLR